LEISACGTFEKGDHQISLKRFALEQNINHLREALALDDADLSGTCVVAAKPSTVQNVAHVSADDQNS